MKVLLVDDSRTMRNIQKRMLAASGTEFFEADDGLQAIELIERTPGGFNLLLIDWNMPVMDGLALIARVHIDHPAIRSIVVSGNASAEQARNAGACGFIAKPYLAASLVQAVHDTVLPH